MSQTGVAALERSIDKTNQWLGELCVVLHTEDRQAAYLALRATLQAVRDFLEPGEAVDLAAQLPTFLRGVYFEGWRQTHKPARPRDKAAFLGRVAPHLKTPEYDAERVVRETLGVLAAHVSVGELDDVKRSLPADVRALWPATPAERLHESA